MASFMIQEMSIVEQEAFKKEGCWKGWEFNAKKDLEVKATEGKDVRTSTNSESSDFFTIIRRNDYEYTKKRGPLAYTPIVVKRSGFVLGFMTLIL